MWIQGVVVRSASLGVGVGGSVVVDDSTGPPVEVYVPPSCRTYSMRTASSETTENVPPPLGSYVAGCLQVRTWLTLGFEMPP